MFFRICLLILILFAGSFSPSVWAQTNHQLVDIRSFAPTVLVDLQYAKDTNFTGVALYQKATPCLLQLDAAKMLAKAAELLSNIQPDYRLIVYDCLRPLSVQKKMWDLVKNTQQAAYVANPNSSIPSLHNYGCAVDLSIVGLNMGTAFDYFGPLAEPKREGFFLGIVKLSLEQWKNRLLLRFVMTSAGFLPLHNEWWHFSCATRQQAKNKYRVVP